MIPPLMPCGHCYYCVHYPENANKWGRRRDRAGRRTFARSPNGGLIVVGSGASIRYRDLIVALAARHKLLAVYWERFFVVAGGLISYGAQTIDQYRRAAGYVDRILKGEKPADLPVQAPTKYETAINLTTAKALGLSVPLSVQQRADEVIE
jgi:putative tryptophan/tyrosine transport system substrate-binding protein